MRGQLSTLPRKSAEPMALAAGIRPRSLQEFLNSDDWDEDRLRERLQQLVAREHADEQSIGIIDESGHPKKGARDGLRASSVLRQHGEDRQLRDDRSPDLQLFRQSLSHDDRQ